MEDTTVSERIALQPNLSLEARSITRFLPILRRHLPALAKSYQVKSLGLFGSHVRDQQRVDSDLDILVEFYQPPGLFKFVRLENYLSDLLGVRVDLVMKDALKPAIGRRILQEVVPV